MWSGLTRKRGSGRSGLGHEPEIGGGLEALGRIDLRQGQREITAQLLGQRQVGRDLLIGEPQAEPLGRAAPLEAHRDEDQGRVTRLVRCRGLVPFESAQREVEDADAAFLVMAAGVVIQAQQPALETLRAELGLQPQLMPGVLPELLMMREAGLAVGAAGGRRQPRKWIPALILLTVGLGLGLGAGMEDQPPAVFNQAAEQSLAALARHLDGIRARDIEQPVARGEVEQLLARLL